MRIAIIDLGTNTFNLLIGDSLENRRWQQIFKTKEAVKLGQGGIHKGYIAREAFLRGLEAMDRHAGRIREYQVDKILAFGTSALRGANNGKEFIDEIEKRHQIAITLISGEKEADLIYKGVIQTLPEMQENFLILDIGGGSNEFIIANDHQHLWKESYKLGMARLMELFTPTDPVTPELIDSLEKYFEEELQTLFQALEKYPAEILVGASGSFDSLVNMLYPAEYPSEDKLPGMAQVIPLNTFTGLFGLLIHSTAEEREKMQGLEPVRRDMIVLAVIFVNYILKRLRITSLYQSPYALKEGALWEVIQSL